MRNIRAEKAIAHILTSKFELDNARCDVTVHGDEAEITGILINRATGKPMNDMQQRNVQGYFNYKTVSGVHRYFFHTKTKYF